MAAAGTLVLVAGGIDLSVGAVYALAAVTSARVAIAADTPAGYAAGIGVGVLAGLANGIVVTVFRINALIATLAMSFVLSGIGALITSGNLIVLLEHPTFGLLSKTVIGGVNSSTWVMVMAVTLIGLLLARATAGRYMYAVGGNAEAARLAGVPVRSVRILTFVLSGAAAGLGGVLIASRVLSAQASSGTDIAFTVLAGIVVGGTSIAGGEGAVWRTVIGVLFIALIGQRLQPARAGPAVPADRAGRDHPARRGAGRSTTTPVVRHPRDMNGTAQGPDWCAVSLQLESLRSQAGPHPTEATMGGWEPCTGIRSTASSR